MTLVKELLALQAGSNSFTIIQEWCTYYMGIRASKFVTLEEGNDASKFVTLGINGKLHGINSLLYTRKTEKKTKW